MNPKPEMFTEKFQMLVLACVSTYQKKFWLKQWNQSRVFKGAQKFP
jgi:hypothetical protein